MVTIKCTELMVQDDYFILTTLFLIVALLTSLFVFKFKRIPTGRGGPDLPGKSYILFAIIYFTIFLFCTVIAFYRIIRINNFIRNGIITTAEIQNSSSNEDNKWKFIDKLKIFYTYEIQNNTYYSNSNIYNKKTFNNYSTGAEIMILVNPNNFEETIFVKKLDDEN